MRGMTLRRLTLRPGVAALTLALAIGSIAGSASATDRAARPAAAAIARDAGAPQATTLDNGLRVIVWTDRDIPNVALYNWVRVGSRNEAPGTTGLAHFFEHMMFNGTARRAPGEFDRLMEASGGANNAFTSSDVTVYQDWFPRSALELVFELEADRFANLAFDPKVIESERGVVFSERRLRVDDSNDSFLAERVQATAFVAHPYQIPTIGWPSDIRSWRIEDLQQFFRTYYAPNNCTLVIVGDIAPEDGFELARRHFVAIPRQPPPPAVRTVEPEQLGEKRLRIERPALTPLLQYAYKAPAATDPRGPALRLLVTALAQGDASRLHRLLVEERKLAISVGSYWDEGFDPGLLWLMVTLPQGGAIPEVERVLDTELARVAREGLGEAELRRAKNLEITRMWRGLATIDGKARLLGQYEVVHGDYRRLFEAPARIEAVTVEDVRAIAAEVLQTRRRTVGVLEGQPAPAGAAS
jgi:zinc protease